MSITSTGITTNYLTAAASSATLSSVTRIQEEARQDMDSTRDSVQIGRSSSSAAHGYRRELTTEDKRDILTGLKERLSTEGDSSSTNSTASRLSSLQSILPSFDAEKATDTEVSQMFDQVQRALRPPQDGLEPGDGPPPPEAGMAPAGQLSGSGESSLADGEEEEKDLSGTLFKLLTEAYFKEMRSADRTESKSTYTDRIKASLKELLQANDGGLNQTTYEELSQKLDRWSGSSASELAEQ